MEHHGSRGLGCHRSKCQCHVTCHYKKLKVKTPLGVLQLLSSLIKLIELEQLPSYHRAVITCWYSDVTVSTCLCCRTSSVQTLGYSTVHIIVHRWPAGKQADEHMRNIIRKPKAALTNDYKTYVWSPSSDIWISCSTSAMKGSHKQTNKQQKHGNN